MTTRRKFKSDAFEAIHSSAQALFKVGGLDKVALRDFDEACLTVIPAIKAPKT
jgi:putative transcriptional regulator